MDNIRRYMEGTITAPTTPCGLSIGSPSQRLFDSDSDNENNTHRQLGTCNGYNSHPGSKSNLLLCMQCDMESRNCSYRPRKSVNQTGRYLEEERALRCQECYAAQQIPPSDDHCVHCDIMTHDEQPDLICFGCEDDDRTTEEEGMVLCSKCEEPSTETTESPGKNGSGTQASSSSETGSAYPVDAVVKIHVNDKSFDGDSDDTNDDSSAPINNREFEPADRLSPIVEHVQSVDNNDANGAEDESNSTGFNGQHSRYLNSMLVLFL
ncbi:uncharacterized protein LOC106693694 [Microplitis demolitor]|uniref:uncharacterized protein LOC106693694 n=1 Tax=Microplitis demolitor TaxID=69319 RepID=UPI0006D50733|nr:uncharacterized protein LOC106693694 [Microplitis demolitor]